MMTNLKKTKKFGVSFIFLKNQPLRISSVEKKYRAVSNVCHSIVMGPMDYFMSVYGVNTSFKSNSAAVGPLNTIFGFARTTLPQHIFPSVSLASG